MALFIIRGSFIIFLASVANAAALRHSVTQLTSSVLTNRVNTNLTQLTNATSIVQNLEFTSNCTLAVSWYGNLPSTGGAGSGNDSINIEFLRSALPAEYQNESTDYIANLYDDMSSGPLSTLGWLEIAQADVETACISPQFDRQVSLSGLNATQNCTATALFLSSLGWITSTRNYTASDSNDTSWLEFINATLPAEYQSNITDLELLNYRSFFLNSENTSNLSSFLVKAFDDCQGDICEVQGYTGNPEIGGIGVILSYTLEVALVTIYFITLNAETWMSGARYSDKIPRRFHTALLRASDAIATGAFSFSLSISVAGWASIVSATSYYEKLLFTSANVLGLSALFAFFGIFTQEGRKRAPVWTNMVLVLVILLDSTIQYIVYLKESDDRYDDYACLHAQFQKKGYHPAIFVEALFLLVGLVLFFGIMVSWFRVRFRKKMFSHAKAAERGEKNVKLTIVETCTILGRLFIQVVAIIVMWAELIYLWKIRSVMAKIAGGTWQEGNWGFGQILALFVWLPTILDILAWLILPEWMLGLEKRKIKVEYNNFQPTKQASPSTSNKDLEKNEKDEKKAVDGEDQVFKGSTTTIRERQVPAPDFGIKGPKATTEEDDIVSIS